MRALFILNTFPPYYTGGAEVSAYHSARGLARTGVECCALILNAQRPQALDEWFTLDGLPVHRIHTRPGRRSAWRDIFSADVYRAAKAELRRFRPDVVHFHNVSGTSLAAHMACAALGVPAVQTLHDYWLLCQNNMLYRDDGSLCPARGRAGCGQCFRGYDFWGDIPGRRLLFRVLTAGIRRFISPSQRLIEIHVAAGYRRERFALIPLGLDEAPREPAHPRVREIIDSAPGRRTLVFAGGGLRQKGIGTLIEALPTLRRRIEGLRVVVVGGGEQAFFERLRAFEPAVIRLDKVPFGEMRALFASADLTLTPSTWHDNSPVVIYESLQMGTPIVGSDLGGIRELAQEGETGYIFPAGDAGALAEKVVAHFARPASERRALRQRCVRVARERLSLDLHVRRTLDEYVRAAGGRAA